MKAVILARVSTNKQEQEGLSLREMQLPRLRSYGSEKGFEIDKEFVFSESADQKIRTKFSEMIEYVKENKDIKYIIAFRVDRITRNFRDAVLIDELMSNHDIELHFVEDRLIINKNTVGRDIQDWDLKVFLGKQYINRLREDATNSANHKLSNGEWPAKAPYGYRNIALDTKKKFIEPDGIKAKIVKAMFEWYSTGIYSMLQVRSMVKKEFEVDLSKGMIDRILKCKFYHGVMEFNGIDYVHKYETIISPATYSLVQTVKANYGKKTGHKFAGLPFVYRGLITCAECGSAVSPERKKGKYIYYKCTEYHGKHGAKYIREEDLTEQIKNAFKSIETPDYIVTKIKTTVKKIQDDKNIFYKDQFNHYQREHLKYAQRIDKMYLDKLDGLITAEEYQKRNADYRVKQAELTNKMDHLQKADEEYYAKVEQILYVASNASKLFASSELEQKRLLIGFALQNLKLKGSDLVYDWIKPFDSMLVRTNRPKWLPGWDSNLRPIG